MLEPSSRRLLMESLQPPHGFRLDWAVGTTYSLDLLALLSAPVAFAFSDWQDRDGRPSADPLALLKAVRQYASRICLFCQAGKIHVPKSYQPLLASMEESVVEANAPLGGSFHPKLWFLRFVDGESVVFRLLCLSRNMTFDRSWDTLLRLEGPFCERTEHEPIDVRSFAGPLAHAFLTLFNLPEVTYLLRDRKKEIPYWASVLEYCAAGNLQAVLDEHAHLLVESLGLIGSEGSKVANAVSKAISDCLMLRTSTAQADIIAIGNRRIRLEEPIRMRTRFAMRFGDQDAEDGVEPTRADHVRNAFNSPFWPFVLATTSVGQEGLDFHPYCHAVVHWNLPSNPVDLEQREGRVHRYKGHALRKNIAAVFGHAPHNGHRDPWEAMFDTARASRSPGGNDLYPYWVAPDGAAKIERHVLAFPHSRERNQQANLRRSLVLYRMVFGQNRQDDLLDYLTSSHAPEELERLVDSCRIDLSPPALSPDQDSQPS